MPKDKREFCGSISVRIDTKRCKLELSPAENYGGPEGLFRVRMGRRWIETPEGAPLFFDRVRLADLLAGLAFGEQAATLPEQAPDVPNKARVTVRYEKDGVPQCEGAWSASPPFRGFDGRFHIFVLTYGAGLIAVPTDDVTVSGRRT